MPPTSPLDGAARLTIPLACLPRDEDRDGVTLPAGTPVRDIQRLKDHGALGWAWSFSATLDGGVTWRAYETQWDESEGAFPVEL